MTQAPTDALRLVPVNDDALTNRKLAVALSSHPEVMVVERSDPSLELTERSLEKVLDELAAAPASPLPRGGDMDWQSVAMWMGFSASVIKNGEPWSDQCQQHYDEAKAAFARLAAPTGDA